MRGPVLHPLIYPPENAPSVRFKFAYLGFDPFLSPPKYLEIQTDTNATTTPTKRSSATVANSFLLQLINTFSAILRQEVRVDLWESHFFGRNFLKQINFSRNRL